METADAVLRASGHAGPLESTPRLYLAAPLAILDLLRSLAPAVVRPLVVGHNPGLEQLVFALSGRHERMPTAAVAGIELPVADWTELELRTPGRLVTLMRPEEP